MIVIYITGYYMHNADQSLRAEDALPLRVEHMISALVRTAFLALASPLMLFSFRTLAYHI